MILLSFYDGSEAQRDDTAGSIGNQACLGHNTIVGGFFRLAIETLTLPSITHGILGDTVRLEKGPMAYQVFPPGLTDSSRVRSHGWKCCFRNMCSQRSWASGRVMDR